MEKALSLLEKIYSKKETAIIEGVLTLLGDGKKIYDIKVSDIAKAAGIGKGTVYEYFSSKEAIFSETIQYKLNEGFCEVKKIFEQNLSFKQTFYAMLENATGVFNKNEPSLWSIVNSLIQENSDFFTGQADENVSRSIQNTGAICARLILKGVDENVLPASIDPGFASFVFNGAVASFVQSMNLCNAQQVSTDRCKLFAYEMLTKALT